MAIKAKKSLGQHFLRSTVALTQIIDAGSLTANDTVLEIGPGEGALTEKILATGAKTIVVETDERCIPMLKERFVTEIAGGQLSIIEGDIRSDTVLATLFDPTHLGDRPYKLIANIPYYITGMLFRLFLEHLKQPERIIFLIQKEVANEIVARDGKEGLLSLSVKAYGTPKVVAKVKKEAFSPPPKVDSAIIAVTDISRVRLQGLADQDYFTIVRAGLHARRKMLIGNLVSELGYDKATLLSIFTQLGISATIRGEDLPIEQWIRLAHALYRK